MNDPDEGLAPDGTIRTGASAIRIRPEYRPVLDRAIETVIAIEPGASVYVYGSVATGRAEPPRSDVDLLTVGLQAAVARDVAADLSSRFADRCRAVEIAPAQPADLVGEHDEAYGGRVFLHHYCVLLAGPERDRATGGFAGDGRAARGFNGDLARHVSRWNAALADADPVELGRRVARKTLLAVAGLVSVHDATWTTDRERAAHRWRALRPDLDDGLLTLLAWCRGDATITRDAVAWELASTVEPVRADFESMIGLWNDPAPPRITTQPSGGV